MSKKTPRAHQVKGMQMLRAEYAKGNKWTCVVMPTGAGKSALAAFVVDAHIAKDIKNKVLIVAHREELVGQLYDTMTVQGIRCGVIQASPTREVNPLRRVQIASIQTLVARDLHLDGITMFVYDECFVAGTDIDGTPIEKIKVGDSVRCMDHTTGKVVWRRVISTSKSVPTGLVSVDGVVCTPNHPFYVPGKGYVQAKDLQGEWIVRDLRWANCGSTQDVRRCMPQDFAVTNDVSHECDARSAELSSRADVRSTQPDVGHCDARAYGEDAAGCGTSAKDARRERSTVALVSGGACEPSGGGYGVFSGYGEGCALARSSAGLQAGLGDSCREVGHRVGWWFARQYREARAGSPQGDLLSLTRVDRVEVLQPGSDGTYGGRCPDGHVYNFGVAEHHNYFAEGRLVHNCHHSLSEGWSVLALKYKATGAYGLGLTATPIRSDGLPLGDVFDALVQPITVKELISLGLLTDFDIRRPPSQLKKLQIAQRPVDAYRALAPGSKGIVFSSNVKTAKDQAKEFCDAGIPAEALDGKTASGDRVALLKRFKAGTTRVICNCGVLTEGFDDPECSTVILARNVGSVALYLQMVGRALRPHPNRGDAMVIDLCGSSWTHGTPADEREWTLDGEGIRKKKQEQAPERFCPSCGVLMDKDATECGECGKLGQAMLTPEVTGAKLVKYEGMRKKSPTERAKSLRKWMTEAEMAGHKIGKAFYKYKAVFGEYPPNDVIQAAKK